MLQLLIEVLIVAILVTIVGTTLTYIGMGEERNRFNEWFKIIIIFALTGAIVHLFCEFTGLNKMYCRDGYACNI